MAKQKRVIILKPRRRPKFLPERKPPSARRHRWLASGQMTKPTVAIKDYAAQFPSNNLHTVHAIVKDLMNYRKFIRVRLERKRLRQYYAKRTADEVLRTKTIVMSAKREASRGRPNVAGCLELSNVLAAVLRYKGIPASFVRQSTTSKVHFILEGKLYYADVLREKIEPLVGQELSDFEASKQLGFAAEGLDSWSVGIRNLEDFHKYMARH